MIERLPALAAVADAADVPLIVDNTLATPILIRPAVHGAAVVVHSATKYLAGGGTVLGGAVVVTDRFRASRHPERWPQLTAPRRRFGGRPLVEGRGDAGGLLHLLRAQLLNDLGPTLSPWNAQRILDGLETLDVRVDRHCAVAEDLVRRLVLHPAVSAVRHPSRAGSPDAAIARRDFPRGAGAVLSFELADGVDAATFFDSLTLVDLAVNLGDARTMTCHPHTMTHCRLTEDLRVAGGITDRTVRLAVGREDPEDLWQDLSASLDAARRPGAGTEAARRPVADTAAVTASADADHTGSDHAAAALLEGALA